MAAPGPLSCTPKTAGSEAHPLYSALRYSVGTVKTCVGVGQLMHSPVGH